MKKLILEGFPPSHAVHVNGPLVGQECVSADGHRPGTIDPTEAMREALGPDLADRCMGRAGHVPGEAELANWEAFQRAVYGWPPPTGVPGITEHPRASAK